MPKKKSVKKNIVAAVKTPKKETLPLLSIALITKNEEKNIPDLLESLSILQKKIDMEIIPVDTGSDDNTIKIFQDNKIDVYKFEWVDDFSKARNAGLKMCKGKFIMWLDADDRIPEETSKWLIENINKLDENVVCQFNIESPESHDKKTTFIQSRLFPNFKGIEFENAIHESIGQSVNRLGIKGMKTEQKIIHTGYMDADVIKNKQERNIEYLERAVKDPNTSDSILFSLARTYHLGEKFNEAHSLYKRILGSKEKHPDIRMATHTFYGQLLHQLGHVDKSELFFRQNYEYGKTNPHYLFEMGKLLLSLNKKSDAKVAFQQLLGIPDFSWTVPINWDAIYQNAVLLLQKIKKEENSIWREF